MKKIFSFFAAILFAGSMMATDYQKVTSASDLVVGAKYVIGTDAGSFIATDNNGNNRKITTTTVNDGVVTATDAMMVFTLGGDAQGWTFATENYLGTAGYLNATSTTGSNYLKVVADLDQYAYFTIVIEEGVTTVTCTGKESRNILYQNGTTCFACYNNQTSSQYHKPNLYKEVAGGGETPAHTYTVAGSSDVAFGTTWAPTNTANDMTLVEGLYKWEKTGLTLAAGNILFKVCEDHAWTNCWPSDNYVLNIPEAGVYTLTITYNPEGNVVNGVAQKTDDAVVIPSVAMHGNFLGSWADTENFAIAEGNETASLTLNLAAGDYEFGMRIGGSGNWTANGAAFTRENNSAVIVDGQGNITLDADAAGEYTFTWTYETNTLTITYPEFVPPTYTYADGYYLIGLDMQEWTMEYMPTEGRLFAVNPDNEGEYQLTITLAAEQQFKVVLVQKDQIKSWYPDGMDNNYVVDAAHAGEKTVYFRPDGQGGEGWHYGVIYVAANEDQPVVPTGNVIYDWAGEIGATILGASGVEVSTVKIHTNTESVQAIKFGNSYNYADGKWVAIKPAEGGFKAGDTLKVAGVYSHDATDGSKYAQIDVYAADGETSLFRSDPVVNGKKSADDPVVENYVLAADADSLFLGRYGNTGMFITLLKVVRGAGETPETPKFYITGESLVGSWEPNALPSYEDTYVFKNLAAGTYVFKITVDGTWQTAKGFTNLTASTPGVLQAETDDNIYFMLDEAGDVSITYNAENFYVSGNFHVDEPADPTVAVKGSMNDWAAEIPFELSEDKTYASLTVEHISADEYEFKLIINGEWRSNGYRYHREFTGAAGITENNEANMVFVADVDGQYTFKWTFADNSLLITYPAAQPGTGFENTAADTKAVKSIKNGILVIEKNNKVYNVLGIEMK